MKRSFGVVLLLLGVMGLLGCGGDDEGGSAGQSGASGAGGSGGGAGTSSGGSAGTSSGGSAGMSSGGSAGTAGAPSGVCGFCERLRDCCIDDGGTESVCAPALSVCMSLTGAAQSAANMSCNNNLMAQAMNGNTCE